MLGLDAHAVFKIWKCLEFFGQGPHFDGFWPGAKDGEELDCFIHFCLMSSPRPCHGLSADREPTRQKFMQPMFCVCMLCAHGGFGSITISTFVAKQP